MDHTNELGEAGDRKSLVISRLQLFEQINADRSDANRVGIRKKPVSRRSSDTSDPDDDSNRSVNCVNSDRRVSDSGIESREYHIRDVQQNHVDRSKKAAEHIESDLLPGLNFSQNDSPYSKRISYNIAVSKGDFAKVLPREQPKREDAINEGELEERKCEKSNNEDHSTIDKEFEALMSDDDSAINEEVVKVEKSDNDVSIQEPLQVVCNEMAKCNVENGDGEKKLAEKVENFESVKNEFVEILPTETSRSIDTIEESDHEEEADEKSEILEAVKNEFVEILPTEPSKSIDTIDESDRRENSSIEEQETRSSSNDIVSRVNTDQRTEIPSNVIVENTEDLSNTKLAENNVSVISSSRITYSNADRTDKCRNSKNYQDYPQELNPFGDDDEEPDTSESKNPFDSDDEQPEAEQKRHSKVSTNPFWSGSEEEEDKSDSVSLKKTPVPLPRTVKKPIVQLSPQPSPKPRIRSTSDEESTTRINNVSPSPSHRSLQSSGRKLSGDSLDVSFPRSPGSQSVNSTIRKKKPAPPPPVAVRTANDNENQNRSNEQISKTNAVPAPEQNTRKSSTSPWKNKKGPAPARPIPIRRPVKEMPTEDINTELGDIEVRQQELDRQGKQLEEMIRRTNADNAEDASSSEELVLQLFEIVNEKNELLRRQSELMYMRKMHNLEEEYAETEYQYRCLMLRPESNKTDSDKTKEEELLRRLLEVVEKRNEIIEAMENDRLREIAEDKSVTTQLDETKCDKDEKQAKKLKKLKKEKAKEHKEEGSKSPDSKHSPSKVIKQKFMTLRHSAKKLNTKIPH